MNIGEILIWEATNGLLLIPIVIGLVMLTRWMRGRPVYTERDWLFLTGHPREKALSLHLWLRFAMVWLAVVLIGFVEGYVLLPFGLAAFLGGVFLTMFVLWRVAPKMVRLKCPSPIMPADMLSWVASRLGNSRPAICIPTLTIRTFGAFLPQFSSIRLGS